MSFEAEDQIPIPCNRCAAPMHEVAGAHPPAVECDHCGKKIELPEDQSERVQFLRRRLKRLHWARSQTESWLGFYVTGWWLGLMFVAIVFVPLVVYYLKSLLRTVEEYRNTPLSQAGNWNEHLQELADITDGDIGAMLIFSGFSLLWLGPLPFTIFRLRPLLRASPAESVDGQARCRSCGGGLPLTRKSFHKCEYCGATNLLTSGAARHVGDSAIRDVLAEAKLRNRATAIPEIVSINPYSYAVLVVAVGLSLGFINDALYDWYVANIPPPAG